jgi:hypothetical protein
MKDTHIEAIVALGCKPGNQFVMNYFVNEIKVTKQDLLYHSFSADVPVECINNFYNELSKEERDAFLEETEMELEAFEEKMAGVYGSFENMQKEFNR